MEKLNNIKYALLIVLLGGVLGCSKSKDINAPIFGGTISSTYTNPVYKGDAPDPTVIRARDGKFYVYSTTTKILESTDMVNWTEGGNVFSGSNYPSWLPGGSVWAPDIHYIGGKYVMYYALSTWGEIHKNGVGVATALDPAGPFTDLGSLVVSQDCGVLNSIDPCYYDENGHKYLIWGSFQGIYYIELNNTGLKVLSGSKPVQLAGNAFEGTYIYKHNNYYYLFASVGSCCNELASTYQTVVGRSTSLLGPYVDKSGKSMMDNGYEVVISGSNAFKGTGHNSGLITDDKGVTWILYHAWNVADVNAGRCLMLDPITWVNDWPTVKDSIPSSTPVQGPAFNN